MALLRHGRLQYILGVARISLAFLPSFPACPHLAFASGVGAKRFTEPFAEQKGSVNGRPFWGSATGYYLYHKPLDEGTDGKARWIISNAINQELGYAMLETWALSPTDARDVSPNAVWQVHDGKDWLTDSATNIVCANASLVQSFWFEIDAASQLTGAYMQTGTMWQGGRRVFEHRPSWPAGAASLFFYWLRAGTGEDSSKWFIGPVVGDTASALAYHVGEELGPSTLFTDVSSTWWVYVGGHWQPAAAWGKSGMNWWTSLQRHRNSTFTDACVPGNAKLLRNGICMPSVGSGTDGLSVAELSSVLAQGARLLDTATISRNEADLATALRTGPGRANVFLVSKVWHDQLGFNATLVAVGNHLKQLGTAYIDLLLIQWPRCNAQIEWMNCQAHTLTGYWQESWRAFEKLYAEGRVRSIGISNFDYNELWEALVQQYPRVQPHVIQNWFEPLQTDDAVRDLAAKYDVQYMGYSPLRNTLRPDAAKDGGQLAGAYSRVREVASKIGSRMGKSIAAVILRWMLELGIVIIPRSSQQAHQQENLDVLNWHLSAEHVRALSTLAWSRDAEL